MNKSLPVAIYWDSSSVLSALFEDSHSEEALKWARREGVHLLSTLGYAEVYAVISRIKREKLLSEFHIDVSLEMLKAGPWRHLNIWPEWNILQLFSSKWILRGSDIWHLATVKTLKKHLPELKLLTFDSKLKTATRGEGLLAK